MLLSTGTLIIALGRKPDHQMMQSSLLFPQLLFDIQGSDSEQISSITGWSF